MRGEQTREPTSDDLRAHRFFRGLDDRQLETLASLARFEEAEQGTTLIQEGQPADAARILLSGRISILIAVPGRPEAAVSTVSKGEMLGFSALIPNGRWAASARALKPCSMIVLPADALQDVCDRDHSVGYVLTQNSLRAVSDQLRDSRLQLLDIFGQQGENWT